MKRGPMLGVVAKQLRELIPGSSASVHWRNVSIIFLPLAGAHLVAALLSGIFLAYFVFMASSLSACGHLR